MGTPVQAVTLATAVHQDIPVHPGILGIPDTQVIVGSPGTADTPVIPAHPARAVIPGIAVTLERPLH